MNRFFAPIAAAVGLAAASPAADPPPLNLLVLGDKPTRVELGVEVDGTPVAKRWADAFAALFAFHDRDGNGELDQTEAARLPSAFALRQIAWGQFAAGSGEPPAFADLDANADGAVRADELAGFYRRAGLGNVLVGVGKPPVPDALSAAIRKRIDADGDGKTTAAEWAKAEAALLQLDANDDELVTANELVDKSAYPGALGAVLLSAPSPTARPDAVADGIPLVVLDSTVDAGRVAKRGGMSADSLRSLRENPPARVWAVRLGKGAAPAALASHTDGNLQFHLRSDDGKLPDQTAAARKRSVAAFAEFDTNADGTLDATELTNPKARHLRANAGAADRDGDGTLTKPEFGAWLDLREQFAAAHVLLTVIDRGPGLFEILDGDHDGALSVRELRTAWPRLKAAGCVTGDEFDRAKLPRVLLATVSRGHPKSAVRVPGRAGPEWFRAMDRNQDGDVSRREFTGDPALFDKLDADKNGLISPDEAAKAGK